VEVDEKEEVEMEVEVTTSVKVGVEGWRRRGGMDGGLVAEVIVTGSR